MKKLTFIFFLLSIFLHFGCKSSIQDKENEEKEIIENYYDILKVIIQDQNSFNNGLVVFSSDSLHSDTVNFRNYALVIHPHDWFMLDSSKSNIRLHYSGYLQPLNSFNFLTEKDFEKHKAFSDTILMPTWDTTRITGCRTVDYGENSRFKASDKRKEGDILLVSYPFLDANKDSAMVYTSFYTQDNQIDKIINLVKKDATWQIINKVIFLLDIREQTYRIDESRSKKETVFVFKGRYYE